MCGSERHGRQMNRVLYSSTKHDWRTPPEFFAPPRGVPVQPGRRGESEQRAAQADGPDAPDWPFAWW